MILDEWVHRFLCTQLDHKIVESTHKYNEPAPTVLDMRNISIANGMVYSPCFEVFVQSEKLGRPQLKPATWKFDPEFAVNRQKKSNRHMALAFMARRFDVFNPFEGMHIFVNLFRVRHLFNISKKTPIFLTDKLPTGREFNKHLWSLFATKIHYLPLTSVRFNIDRLIMLPSSGVSLLNYYNKPFRLCPTLIDFSHFITRGIAFQSDKYVVISQRKPYARNDILYNPKRTLSNWNEVIHKIETHHSVKMIDLASLKTYDILKLVRNAEALVGVHGAGLVWSLFMKQRSKLFEIFGGNRGISNAHYKKIATYVHLKYDYVFVKNLECTTLCTQKLMRFLS